MTALDHDALLFAEAVAAGRMTLGEAEAELRRTHRADAVRSAASILELHTLVDAIRGVRRHAEAVRQAEAFEPGPAIAFAGPDRDPTGDRQVAPSRVRGGGVHVRDSFRSRTPRWATFGSLAAAAVIVIAIALVGPGLLTTQVATSPSPAPSPTAVARTSPTPGASPASPTPTASSTATASPTPVPTPKSSGSEGIPSIPTEALAGSPAIGYWTLADANSIVVTEWLPDGGTPAFAATVPTWPDPDLAGGIWVDRRIVVSPDGRRIAFNETNGSSARTRVFRTDGTLVWTDPAPTLEADMAWSTDGSALVIGSQPATWKILTFSGNGAPSVKTRAFAGQAFRVIGFSVSGTVLYGWDTNGEADWWQTPFQVVVPNGAPVTISRFSGKAEPLGVSNATTPALSIAPGNGTSTESAGVDPKTGKVLDTGGLSGRLNGWEVRDGTTTTKLKGLTMSISLAWGPNGSIVVADVNQSNQSAEITTVAPGAPATALTPTFSIATGAYWRLFEGSRAGFALLGLGAERSHEVLYLGADELVAIDLATARSAVLAPGDKGLTGLHVAGWITAP